jgi:hypothetical protein
MLRGTEYCLYSHRQPETMLMRVFFAIRRALTLNPALRILCFLDLAAFVGGINPWPWSGLCLVACILLTLYLGWWGLRAWGFADMRIRAIVGPTADLPVHSKVFPTYKWVDLYRAAETHGSNHTHVQQLPAPFNLRQLLQARIREWSDFGELRIRPPETLARAISASEETLLPLDSCWCYSASTATGGRPQVVRISYQGHIDKVIVEVAAHTTDAAKQVMTELTNLASQHSIYRNQSIRIVFEPGPPNRFGEQDLDRGMNLRFLQERSIDEESIVLDDLTRSVLEHTVVDFHRRREQLMALGLPGKRGVLFYGPPGTGKTYTSAYLGQRLHDATKIIVAGKSLLRMADVCAIATSLQPALVILEDVDLVFSDRELAPSTTLLGEFLDQLDGFANNDQIIFILTTNVLERVEAAIKDRPGRVSQCIFFGPPSAELRRRYLESQTRRFETSQVRFDRVVAQTDGGSQAFLKELILRAVQIASVRPYIEGRVVLTDTDFELAVREMTTAGGKLGKRIIGFQIE